MDEFLNQFGIGLGGTGPGLKLLSSVEAVRDSGWFDSATGLRRKKRYGGDAGFLVK